MKRGTRLTVQTIPVCGKLYGLSHGLDVTTPEGHHPVSIRIPAYHEVNDVRTGKYPYQIIGSHQIVLGEKA